MNGYWHSLNDKSKQRLILLLLMSIYTTTYAIFRLYTLIVEGDNYYKNLFPTYVALLIDITINFISTTLILIVLIHICITKILPLFFDSDIFIFISYWILS